MFLIYLKNQQNPGGCLEKPVALCPSYSSARKLCKRMMAQGYPRPEVAETVMIVDLDVQNCTRTDTKIHIPLDLNKMAFPARCKKCPSNATYFCNAHSELYCTDHITNHTFE